MSEPQKSSLRPNSASLRMSSSMRDNGVVEDQSALYIGQLQQQLQSIRKENEDFASNTINLQKYIHQLEEDKVALSGKFNKEHAELQSFATRLQSQLERGEAARQSLEYELAVSKKKLNEVTRSNTHKEVTLAKENLNLADEKSSLELKLGEMENELAVARQVTAENEKRIAFLQDDKRQIQSDHMTSEAILRADNDKLSAKVSDLEYQNENLTKRVEDSKEGLLKQEEDLRKLASDLQASLDREERVRLELEELAHRARSLEESVEAERAAHLESKFNSEIIQLKQQEFEAQLSGERESREALSLHNEELASKVTELEKQIEFEQYQARNANAKLEKTVQVYADVRKQLDDEIEEKTSALEVNSEELNKHQKEVEQLKEDLSKTKKKMIVLEENYVMCVREVELLLETFCSEPDPESTLKGKSKSDKKNQIEHQKSVLENLRKTLFAYQKKISDLETAFEEQKSLGRGLQKDCENFRDLALSRESEMQSAQQALAQCEVDLERIQARQTEYEREAGRAGRDLHDVTSELQQQTEKYKELEENLNSIQDRHSTELEIHVGYLRELHHVVCSASGEKNTLTRFGWSDLSVTIRESVDSLIDMYHRSKERVGQLELSSQEMQHSINELQRAHSSSVDRLAERCREREEDAIRQRKQLEQHYEALIAEMHSRAQKTQSLCDEAWERVRSKDGVQEGLHAECAQLRGENGNMKQERKALLCACAILFGALYPTLRARDELAQQRALLARINTDGEDCKMKMRILVDTLTDEFNSEKSNTKTPNSFRAIHPLIRFRVAAIAVLAANRLVTLYDRANTSMFVCSESAVSNSRIVVMAGKAEKTTPKRKKKDDLPLRSRSDAAVEWLSDVHMVHGIRDATCGVVDAVAKNAGDTSGYMSRAVVKTAKSAFLNLIEATHSRFSCFTNDSRNIIRERTSLCRVLGEGLEKVIHKANLRDVVNLYSVEHSFSALQRHLLRFTERLHAAEVEKRNLRNNEVKLKSCIEQHKLYQAELEQKEKEIKKLKEKERQLVAKERFEGVCSELNSALEREKRAQHLLHEQNDKLQDLTRQYDERCCDGAEKEVTLSQAVTSLSEVKMELKRCSQNKRQLEKQVEKLQHDKDKLQSQVNDAKSALRRAAGEKSTIENYFATVEETLRHSSDETATEKLRLQGEVFTDKAGPGMKAAQRAVETFVRAQSSAVSRIDSLEAQIASYRSHISSLKRELHDACQRENLNGMDGFADMPTRDSSLSMLGGPQSGHLSSPFRGANEFKPLQGEIFEQPSFNQSIPYPRDYRSTHTAKDKSIRDVTNTHQ